MSCTENESGPFVVFFLPAVVGCLTILLARRWANSQVSNTSSTAVSRRRKIIKDPLVKRPLPPIACKMVAPGSKKASGVAKKGNTYPGAEEEVNGVGKRTPRAPRHSPSAPGAPVTEVKAPEVSIGPKHIPFPYIPQDGEILFEAMTCVFVLVATGLQFLNLYRTVWWLPHSTTTQAMNFYLIDPHLVSFIVAVSCRRVLMSIALSVLRSMAPPPSAYGLAALRMFVLGVFLGVISWSTYFIFLKYPWEKMLYLFYPAALYLALFGFQVSAFLELHSEDVPLHNCSQDPNQISIEVANFRKDFNMRVKKILFNGLIDAYYSSFMPLAFAQPYLYYEVQYAVQQAGLVWGALLGRYCSQLLPASYTDTPHRAARHLILTHKEYLYFSEGESENWFFEWRTWVFGLGWTRRGMEYVRFYTVFANPSMFLCLVLSLQLTLIVLQICLLFSSIPWHNFLAIILLLFINYYTLFKMVRDYLVAWKVYKAENMIQEKNDAVNYSTSN